MKKILFLSLALLLVVGVANAANIPKTVDPANHPEVWVTQAYSNSSTDVTSGWVVVWDHNSSSSPAAFTDRLPYVNVTTSADDIWTAGVVLNGNVASAGDVVSIAIWGPVYALTADSSDAVTAGDLVGSYTTAGQCGDFAGTAADNATLGVCIYAAPNTSANGGYGGTDGNDYIMVPIFVDPTRFSDD